MSTTTNMIRHNIISNEKRLTGCTILFTAVLLFTAVTSNAAVRVLKCRSREISWFDAVQSSMVRSFVSFMNWLVKQYELFIMT